MRIVKLACMAFVGAVLFFSGCGWNGTESQTTQETAPAETKQVEMVVPKDGVPVLMYHMIGDVPDNDAVLLESHFREQMKFLKDNDFHPISLDELYGYMKEGKPLPVRPVVLTFDDGYPDTYSIVMPVMKEYGFACTVFVPTYDTDQGTRLTWKQVKEMKEAGMKIASHSYRHERMTDMNGHVLASDVEKSQAELMQQLGEANAYFCYPYGGYSKPVGEVLQKAGIKMAFTMNPGWAKQGDNLYAIKRIWIGNAVDINNFKQRITTPHYEER